MATTRRSHLTTSQDRSPFISERRRKLFPIDDFDMDSELGHISPLCSSDSDDEGVSLISDFDITGIVQSKRVLGNETPTSIKSVSDIMSPLKLSPYTGTFNRETPRKYSPSHNLKTPHDTSTKPMLQKEQKTLLEESKSLKRKSSPSSSPEQSKSVKLDFKSSKVRTALFPPEHDIYAPLSAKSFYSKNQENVLEKPSSSNKYVPKHIKFSTGKHSNHYRKKFGQINNGVGHKIRKPKQTKMSKAVITKAAKKLLETGSVLNDYIQDLKDLRNKQNSDHKLIVNPTILKENATIEPLEDPRVKTRKLISTPRKEINAFPEENKENVKYESPYRSESPPNLPSPKDAKTRKFFKSSRGKLSTQLEKVKAKAKGFPNIIKDVEDGKKFDCPQISKKVFLESCNDFEDDEMDSNSNIDNILSVLSDESPQKSIVEESKYEDTVQNYENSCLAGFDLSNSNIKVLNVVNQTINENYIIDQNGMVIIPIQNRCVDDFNMSQSNFGANAQESAEVSGCELKTSCQPVSSLNSEAYVTSGCQNIDSLQYLHSNTDPNPILTENKLGDSLSYSTIDSFSVNHPPTFIGTGVAYQLDLPNMEPTYNNTTSGPCIVSSQVIFDNILLEETNQTANTLSNQIGTFSPMNKTSNHLNSITLEAHNSILASENSIQLHQSNVANMILSPISQMCDVTSGLALNSPKRGRKLSPFLSNTSRASKILSFTNCHSTDMDQQQPKLFPVFYPGAKGAPDRGEKRERGEVKRSAKKFKALHGDQMLLDAGQKKFGYTLCNECNIIYHMGDPGDELEHLNYHNAGHILRFSGWKNEHLVADFQKNGRVIRVLPTDSKIWLKKVKDLMEFVKRELGCYEMECNLSGCQVYLYIKNRTIAGCAVAVVPKGDGHRMLSSLSGVAMCSEESYPIKCGISLIWVAANFRKQRIATALMDAIKNSFMLGHILTDHDIALTSPTDAGSVFAERYFKTPNYLVYYT